MDNIEGQNIFIWFVNKIVLLELFDDVVLVIDEQGVKFVGHQLRFLVKRDWLCDIFAWKYVSFSNRSPTDHGLVVILILFGKFFEVKMSIGEIHDIMESLLADWGEIFWRFELRGIDDKVKHDLIFMFA